uniref:Uncharacterized protein n=1 Tax=Arundo donax TaxID=35708 RepID=A0A0A9HFL9_ARUDO
MVWCFKDRLATTSVFCAHVLVLRLCYLSRL